MCRMPSWAIYDSTTKSQLSSFLCLVESSQKFFEKSLGCDSNLSAAMHNEPQDVATGMALRNCSRENFERTLHKVMTPHEWIINTNDGFDRSLGWFRWKFTQNKWKRTYYSTNLSGWKKNSLWRHSPMLIMLKNVANVQKSANVRTIDRKIVLSANENEDDIRSSSSSRR